MLHLPGITDSLCSRRSFVASGATGVLASGLNQGRLSAHAPNHQTPISTCIFLTLYGGPSQLDTWDMKPQASAEIRGEYQPISTKVPGCLLYTSDAADEHRDV
mgnify:CR=1 FL=1